MNEIKLENYYSILTSLGVRNEACKTLEVYVNLLWQANHSLNLISRQMTVDELVHNHIIDSFLPLSYFPHQVLKVADFGSGGGMPAVLYAIQFPKIQFRLFEKSPKKREFLKACQQQIAPNIEVFAEVQSKDLVGIELVVARAFKPLDVILTMSREYYLSGGAYFLLKGRKEKIQEELELVKKNFQDREIEVIPLVSPVLDVERHLVRI